MVNLKLHTDKRRIIITKMITTQIQLNYILLAHKNPQQLKRLYTKLFAPYCRFYIHIDKAVDIAPFYKVFNNCKNIYFLTENQREVGVWGDIGIVKATINSLKQILHENRKGYTILMSGQDYPLHSNQYIHDFFSKNYGTHYIAIYPLPHPGWHNNGMDRLTKYKINKSPKRGDFIQLPSIFDKEFYHLNTLRKIKSLFKASKTSEIFLCLKKRKFPDYLMPYAGGQWWALPIEGVKSILQFTEKHPEYLDYHFHTLLPDEIFFHSILMYLKSKKEITINPSITYVNWERKNVSLPVTFTQEDMNELETAAKTKLFARKFDMELDEKVLDLLDNHS